MKKPFALLLALALQLGTGFAHCQVPCGIYGDDGRFDTLNEHVATVEKAMKEKYHLDKSWPVQYVLFMKGLVVDWDLGPSFKHKTLTVNEIIADNALIHRTRTDPGAVHEEPPELEPLPEGANRRQ